MNVFQSSFSKCEGGVPGENIALVKSYITGGFQFDSLNRSRDLKFVSELRFCPCYGCYRGCRERERRIFGRGLNAPSKTLMSMSAEVDASIADSLSARNGVAGFTFV
jgi:hypothetical protein